MGRIDGAERVLRAMMAALNGFVEKSWQDRKWKICEGSR